MLIWLPGFFGWWWWWRWKYLKYFTRGFILNFFFYSLPPSFHRFFLLNIPHSSACLLATNFFLLTAYLIFSTEFSPPLHTAFYLLNLHLSIIQYIFFSFSSYPTTTTPTPRRLLLDTISHILSFCLFATCAFACAYYFPFFSIYTPVKCKYVRFTMRVYIRSTYEKENKKKKKIQFVSTLLFFTYSHILNIFYLFPSYFILHPLFTYVLTYFSV